MSGSPAPPCGAYLRGAKMTEYFIHCIPRASQILSNEQILALVWLGSIILLIYLLMKLQSRGRWYVVANRKRVFSSESPI